jgi:divinyl protochlorophyllide a 8-vinyl-reductase
MASRVRAAASRFAPFAPPAARAPGDHPGARIGPNAIIQTWQALRAQVGAPLADAILHEATGRTPATLPDAMVDEHEAIAMVQRVRQRLDDALAVAVLEDAGRRTARYLLAHRIPRAAQWLMRAAPAPIAFAILASAMARHAWTFAGSGHFDWHTAPRTLLRLHDSPMCRDVRASCPYCDYYAATFDTLVRTLVSRRVVVREVRCRAMGDACCDFAVIPRRDSAAKS